MKANRLSLIASICAKRGMGPKILGVIAPSKEDKREEIFLNVSRDDKATHKGEDLQDADLPALASQLPFESVRVTREKESDYVLTDSERKQVHAELLAYRKIRAELLALRIQQDLSRPRNPYALAIV